MRRYTKGYRQELRTTRDTVTTGEGEGKCDFGNTESVDSKQKASKSKVRGEGNMRFRSTGVLFLGTFLIAKRLRSNSHSLNSLISMQEHTQHHGYHNMPYKDAFHGPDMFCHGASCYSHKCRSPVEVHSARLLF